ncbi:hypothetical protein JDS99_30790, partial [Bacillus cereus group sp. N6]|nr:hypothetical protein [Bacillus cereus group sp. N6]
MEQQTLVSLFFTTYGFDNKGETIMSLFFDRDEERKRMTIEIGVLIAVLSLAISYFGYALNKSKS